MKYNMTVEHLGFCATEQQQRLDKALDIFKRGGDIRFVIPDDDINVGSLKSRIDTGSLEEKLE